MVAEDPLTAKQTFVELAKAETSGDYDKALKIANKILQKFPKETVAFKCKLVALIQLGKFDEALAWANKIPFHQMGDCSFEKAYIQYRLNDNNGAMETLAKVDMNDFRCMELKAQLLYRAERFQEAADLLKKLLKDYSDDYDEDRRANLTAVIAQLQASGQKQPSPKQLESCEQRYNGACYLIEAEKYKEALSQLQKSEELSRAMLTEEGLPEEEIEDELSAIRVQRAFVLQQLGRLEEALDIYTRVQQINPSDKSVVATVNNNIISTRRSLNLLEARRKLKAAAQVDPSKLTARQRRTLALNQALVCMLSNQREPCNKALQEIRQTYGAVQEALIIEAALLLRSKEPQKAIAVLDSASPTDEIRLTCVQFYLNDGKIEEAARALANLPTDLGMRPAILQLRVALLLSLDRKKEALELLSSILTSKGANTEALLEQAASLNLQCENYRAAVECLERLAALKPGNLKVMCRLIKAYSAFDVARAEQISSQVFPQNASASLDVDALERSDWILYRERNRQKKEVKPEQDTEIITGKLRHRKRKRKPLLPKNFDPKVAPDPERWLPKQERTAYRKKLSKKHKEREIGRGTQGAVSSPQFDTAKPKAESSPKPAPTPVMGSAEGPRQQRPAGQQPKKKKKKAGSKW